ncbi:MAG: choice-of-anchor Q domain-containing protein, partial [Acidobacteriota bacterium]
MGVALASATENIINIDGVGGVTISSIVSGSGKNLTLGGAGTGVLTFSGTNTYSGVTKISSSILSVTALANGGSNGNIGSSSNAAGNLIFDGGTLRITGSGQTSNRNFTISPGKTGIIDITADTTIAGAAAATAGSLMKSGGGFLFLSGTNLYTGTTTITGGALGLLSGGSIAASSVIEIQGGTFFDISGTTAGYTLASGQTIRTTGTGAASSTIATASGKVLSAASNTIFDFQNYNGTVPPVKIQSSGSISVASTNTVNISTTSALAANDYFIIDKMMTTGTVIGTAPSNLSVGGSGICAGCTASLLISSGRLVLHVAAAPAPTVTLVAPANGTTAGGTIVTITGTDFTGATAVSFGGTAATSFAVNSATQITATTPGHAAGAVSVLVTTATGTNGANTLFTYVLPNMSINDVSAAEGDSGTSVLTFTVSLSSPAPVGGVTFDIATADDTATAGSDYVAQTLTSQVIAAGGTTYSFNVTINGDTTFEANETFFVNLTNVVGATVADSQGIGTIQNDDAVPPVNVSDDDVLGPCSAVHCSLREAIIAANLSPDANTITFDPSVTAIQLFSALPDITTNMTIAGGGAITIYGGGSTQAPYRPITTGVGSNITLNMTGITINFGKTNLGGALYNTSGNTVNLTSCNLSSNEATGSNGGAIYNAGVMNILLNTIDSNTALQGGGIFNASNGVMTITESTISANSATNGSGGGISNNGLLTIQRSLIHGNTTIGQGGGLFNINGTGVVKMVNSTVSFNVTTGANQMGGGIYNDASGSITLTNCTVTDTNQAPKGGGIYNLATAVLNNTIVANNNGVDEGPDLDGGFTGSFNLIGESDNSFGLTNGVNGNIVGTVASPVDAKLSAKAANGGPTDTYAPLVTSPAVNNGSTPLALDPSGAPLATDQRGTGFARVSSISVDIGAFETLFTPTAGAVVLSGRVLTANGQG